MEVSHKILPTLYVHKGKHRPKALRAFLMATTALKIALLPHRTQSTARSVARFRLVLTINNALKTYMLRGRYYIVYTMYIQCNANVRQNKRMVGSSQ